MREKKNLVITTNPEHWLVILLSLYLSPIYLEGNSLEITPCSSDPQVEVRRQTKVTYREGNATSQGHQDPSTARGRTEGAEVRPLQR